MASGCGNGLDFGQTYVINPTGVHKATIVWLHDIGRTGFDSEQFVRIHSLRTPNIKWIFPTAPKRSVTSLGGMRLTAWFDIYTSISEGMREDLGSLNYVTTYVATLLALEPHHVMRGIGGIGMGAAQALFYATSYAIGRVPIDVKIVIGINGWLPDLRNLQGNMNEKSRSSLCAASLGILITHGTSDDTNAATFAQFPFVSKCFNSLRLVGFPTWFKSCGRTLAMNEIRAWLLLNFGLGA